MTVSKRKASGTRTLKSKARAYIEGLEDGVIELTGEFEMVDRGLETVMAEVRCTGASEKALRCRQEHKGLDFWLPRSQVQFCDATYAPSGAFDRSHDPFCLVVALPMWLVLQHNMVHWTPGSREVPRLPDPELVEAQRGRSTREQFKPLVSVIDEAAEPLNKAREMISRAFGMPAELLEKETGARWTPTDPPAPEVVAKGAEMVRAALDEHERFKAMIDQERSQPSACERLPPGSRGRPERRLEINDEATLTDLLCAEAE